MAERREAVINRGAYGGSHSLSAAAGRGAKEAIAGAVGDYDKAQEAQRLDRESKSKLETANLQQQALRTDLADKERTYRKSYTPDPKWLARQSATTKTNFNNIKTNLFPLKEKQRNGTITEEETAQLLTLEGTVDSFKQVYEAEEVAVAEYNKVGDTTGFDDNSDPDNRLKALALAENKFLLNNVDGVWVYQGEYVDSKGTTVKVEEPAANFLENLNLTAKTDWASSNADQVGAMEMKVTKVTHSNGSVTDDYSYDKAALIKVANADLSTPDKLDSYAFQYLTNVEGLSDEEARQRVDDYGTDGYGEFKTTLRDAHTKELFEAADERVKSVTTKFIPQVQKDPLFSDQDVFTFDNKIEGVNSAFANGNLTDISAGINALGNNSIDSKVDEDGNLTVTRFSDKGAAVSTRVFGADQLEEANTFVKESVLGDKGLYYNHLRGQERNKALQEQLDLEIKAEFKVSEQVLLPANQNSPLVQTGAPIPPKGRTPKEKAIYQLWQENNTGFAGEPEVIAGSSSAAVPANPVNSSSGNVVLEDPSIAANPKKAKQLFQKEYGITYSNYEKLNKLTGADKTKVQALHAEYKDLNAALAGVDRGSKRGKQILAKRNELKDKAATLTGLSFQDYGLTGDGAFSTLDQYNNAGNVAPFKAPVKKGASPVESARTAISDFRKSTGVSFDVKTGKKLNKVLQALGNDWLSNIPTDLTTTVAAQKKIIEDAYNNLNK